MKRMVTAPETPYYSKLPISPSGVLFSLQKEHSARWKLEHLRRNAETSKPIIFHVYYPSKNIADSEKPLENVTVDRWRDGKDETK